MRPSSDVFRPKLPVDPFAQLDADQPWLASQESDAQPSPPRVLLIFGAPSQADLRSLLTSQWLADSLVLIATHSPPSWNGQPVPTVRILRLSNPLEDGGGRELASLFDRAERLAHQWRNKKLPFGDKKLAQLAEKVPGGDFNVLEDYTAGHVACATTRSPSIAPSSCSKAKRRSLIASPSSIPFLAKIKELDSYHQNQRTFDAILHFIPASLPEKDIYKRAILVTTLSVSFLSSPPLDSFSPNVDPPKTTLFSPLLRTKHRQFVSYDSGAATAPVVYHAHLVHVLPTPPPTPPTPTRSLSPSSSTSSISASSQRPPFLARHPSPMKPTPSVNLNSSSFYIPPPLDSNPHPRSHHQPISAPLHAKYVSERQSSCSSFTSSRKRLAQSVEQFLIQFAHSTQPSSDDPQSRSVPYLLGPGVFSRAVCMHDVAPNNEIEALVTEGRLTVGEAILLGLLDDSGSQSFGKLGTRAWIGETQEVFMKRTIPNEDVLPLSLFNSSTLAPPPPARSRKEKERQSIVLQEDPFPELNGILAPYPYPTFHNTPLPFSSHNTGSQEDELPIRKPAPIIPRMRLPLSPPLSMVIESETKQEETTATEIPTIQWSPPHLQSDQSSLKKLAAMMQSSSSASLDTDATESVSSHMAKTASTDHSWTGGAAGLPTPPASCSSESCNVSEYESCEMFEDDMQDEPTIGHAPGPFILFHEQQEAAIMKDLPPVKKKSALTDRIGHRFRSLTKVMSLSTSAVTAMAMSTTTPKRRNSRERNVLEAVVV